MLPDLTPAVTRALDAARAWAARLSAPSVEPEHLLHGLLDEEEGRAATLLRDAGLDVAGLRRDVTARSTPVADHAGEAPSPLAAATEGVLHQAAGIAREETAERTVASEHLVLALLEDAGLRRELEAHGLSAAGVDAGVRSAQEPLRLDEPLLLPEATEHIDTARILDAGANRAREALRVIEDYCRFALDDALLSGELKQLRHDLAEGLAAVAPELLVTARETLRDVGTGLSTAREQQRFSLVAVAHANLKRLQEALRSLEEFGKLRGPGLGRDMEQLRYRAYTLERAIVLGTTARQRLADVRLCVLVSVGGCAASLEWTIAEAAAGGTAMIQLREKGLDDRTLLERARRTRAATREARVLFVLNDRPDIARLAEADGVHLGQEDLPVKDARRIVGPDALIGVSTHNISQVHRAVLDGASYLGVGPTFASGTKEFEALAGVEFVRQAAAATSLPAFAIGGIGPDTVGAAVAAGARRVAAGQAVCQADDPRRVAAELARATAGCG
jgi:thiamine-phosphate pyrophosphorylase